MPIFEYIYILRECFSLLGCTKESPREKHWKRQYIEIYDKPPNGWAPPSPSSHFRTCFRLEISEPTLFIR